MYDCDMCIYHRNDLKTDSKITRELNLGTDWLVVLRGKPCTRHTWVFNDLAPRDFYVLKSPFSRGAFCQVSAICQTLRVPCAQNILVSRNAVKYRERTAADSEGQIPISNKASCKCDYCGRMTHEENARVLSRTLAFQLYSEGLEESVDALMDFLDIFAFA